MAKKKSDTPHTALYRSHRPQSFKGVVGQEHIVSVLEEAVAKGKVAHAYLFAGSRGTGKTSVARILAGALEIVPADIYEIDAASNRGVDDVRELREGVPQLPFSSPYKIYIIDEAHMLTKEAWNALLKTLEEPPAHVIFVFATTEMHKVPDTIRSRCDVYTFRQPTRELLAEHVREVAKKEGFTLERSASDLIALLAEGSFRDALGILQKVITISGDKKISLTEIERVTGAPQSVFLQSLTRACAKGSVDGALSIVRKALEAHVDMRVFIKLLLERFRAVILARHAPEVAALMQNEFTEEDYQELLVLGKDKETKINSHTLRALIDAYEMMQYATLPHLPLELALIDLYSDTEKK